MATPSVDHLVLACKDLGEGVEFVEGLLGVRPVPGGEHPDWGTHNALVTLGASRYLEVIAPLPGSTLPESVRPDVFSSGGPPRLRTWAAAVDGISDIAAEAMSHGVLLGEVIHGSRELPDGSMLSWSLTDPATVVLDGVVPFLIDWGGSRHPARGVDMGCELQDFRLAHPDPELVRSTLLNMGLDAVVEDAPEPAVHAVISCPAGRVELH